MYSGWLYAPESCLLLNQKKKKNLILLFWVSPPIQPSCFGLLTPCSKAVSKRGGNMRIRRVWEANQRQGNTATLEKLRKNKHMTNPSLNGSCFKELYCKTVSVVEADHIVGEVIQ